MQYIILFLMFIGMPASFLITPIRHMFLGSTSKDARGKQAIGGLAFDCLVGGIITLTLSSIIIIWLLL